MKRKHPKIGQQHQREEIPMESDDFIQRLEERAQELRAHIMDIDYVVEHKELLRATTLIGAMNGMDVAVDGVKEALRNGENVALVRMLSNKETFAPAPYGAMVAFYALMELERPGQAKEFPEEDLWAMFCLLGKYYEPVPYAPYTREQVMEAMRDE